MDKVKQTQTSQQRYWNIGLAILCLILFFALFSLMVDEYQDRIREKAYKDIIIEQQGLLDLRLDSINKLWLEIHPNSSIVEP